MKKSNIFYEMIGITLATALVAASVYFFLIPSDLPLGSISGLAMLLSKVLPLSMATLTMILNVSLLILGFILLGREFGIKTVYTSILLPAVMGVFEKVFPNPTSLMGDVMSDLLVFSLFVSIGQAILFNLNASSGGLDIVTKILNRFFHIDMGKAAIWSGMVVAGSTIFFYDVRTAILSIFGTYLSGVVLDHFIFGFNERKRVCIISPHEDEIKNFILKDLDAGCTIYEAHGAYDDRTRREIVSIMDKAKYKKLLDFISKIDPTAFVTVLPIHEVYTPEH